MKVLYCYEGSIAAKYAIDNNIKYVYLTKPVVQEPEQEVKEKEQQDDIVTNEDKNIVEIKPEEGTKTLTPKILPDTGLGFGVGAFIIIAITVCVWTFKKKKQLRGI